MSRPATTAGRRGGRAAAGAQRGFSLVEMLVAIAVLALATLVALTIYDEARRSFKSGENAAEQQQGVRIALDRLASDLRMAGFNHNPDGNLDRPDEPFEAVLATALALRADFDASDPVEAVDPEAALATGSPFLAVPTANDEIVAYALAKPDGSSPGTLVFAADVADVPRDGAVETVTIDEVDLAQDDPPYTMYRYHLDDDGDVVRTPMIDNVRLMRFRYFDEVGAEIDPPGGDEDELARAARGAVRRVEFEVEALTRDPHPSWIDPDDPDPTTRRHRKYRLATVVYPRNVGRRGQRDLLRDVVPPQPPGAPTLHPGHCGGLYVVWPPNPADDEVAYYRLRYGPAPDELTAVRLTADSEQYVGGLPDAQQVWAAVEAVDSWGNASPPSPVASAYTENSNTPERPEGLAASDGLDGRIELAWSQVGENTGPTSGDPDSPRIRDLAGYRVYRGGSPGFTIGPATLIADEAQAPALAAPGLTDRTAVNCRPYYYRIEAVDRCGVPSEESDAAAGASTTIIPPAAPGVVNAFRTATVRLEWDQVGENVDGDPIFIDQYQVFRTAQMPAGSTPAVPGDFSLLATVTGTTYDDAIILTGGQTAFYLVRAQDDCVNRSDFSHVAEPTCAFSGQAVFDTPQDGATVSGTPVRVDVVVENGSGSYEKVDLLWVHETTGEDESVSIGGPGPLWAWDWGTTGWTPGPWRIHAVLHQTDGCTYTAVVRVTLAPPGP